MDSLSGLTVFVRVVDAGGFTAAAREMGVSKSAISKQVAGLEERLGARLLNRTTRRLSLTDAGATLYERALRILAEAEEAEAAVSQLSSAPRGLLRINAPVTFGIGHLGPLLPAFMELYPDLSLEVVVNDRMVDLVEEGFDVAVRIADLPDSSLIAKRLCCSRRVVVASPDYVARRGAPRHPEDLANHELVMYAYTLRGTEWRLTGPEGRTASIRADNSRLKANNGDLLRMAVNSGHGVAIMPTFVVGDDLASGRLVRLLPDWQDESGGVYAVWPHARFVPAKVRAFVDFLAEKMAGTPPWEAGLK